MPQYDASVRIILENEAAILRYHSRTKIVHHEFKRFIYGAQFREVLETGLTLFHEHGARKWLSDDTNNGPVRPDDAEWAQNDWGPRVVAAGWKYWAIVLPAKVIGQMNMRRWRDFYEAQGVGVEAFSDPDAALTWLEQR